MPVWLPAKAWKRRSYDASMRRRIVKSKRVRPAKVQRTDPCSQPSSPPSSSRPRS